MIRLLIADDHPVVRAGLRALFATEADMDVVGEAATGEGAVRLAKAGVDLVLMDLQFGEGSQGVDATRRIRESGGPRVLVLTNYDTDADILGAVEAGAAGYLLKDAPPAELLAAVRAAAAGETALAPSVAGRLEARRDAASVSLSLREAEVLDLVANGQSNRTIARQLFLSEATVKSHLVHIFTKLGVSSRTQAVAAARERGLIRSQ
ncbi:response regulator transcription factor [Paramicrobacterium agarici]|uniref:LuxR family two component transcriptional regulator n=1 Tax=Paramicrobacterium agarici TaxID=630514 RepID=A0A2A9DUA8_9MICO|nr:response regulator transcription factor [Microbacterium agarici]PFG30367.1 LuxR family two component transcriptional regulator [Microbacterium agarici]